MERINTGRMEYTFHYNEKEDVIEVQATGRMEDEKFPDVVELYAKVLEKYDCHKTFVDYRKLIYTKDTLEIYMSPQTLVNITGTSNLIIAVIVNVIDRDYKFLETVYLNQGITFKMFTEVEDALDWLRKNE